MLTEDESKRFVAKYRKRGNCWIWQGKLDPDGYGVFWLRRKNRRAHRVAWFSVHGDLSEGQVINHTCRNRACVNPQHLLAVSWRESALRDTTSIAYINSQKTHCLLGHPFDRVYSGQRYCSICDKARRKRLREKWKAEGDPLNI